ANGIERQRQVRREKIRLICSVAGEDAPGSDADEHRTIPKHSHLPGGRRVHRAVNAQDLVDPRFEDRGNSEVVHGRSDDNRISRFDFPNKRFGNIQRALRRRRQGGWRRKRKCVVSHGVEQGFGPQVPPSDARPGRNLQKLFDDRGRRLTAMRFSTGTTINMESVHVIDPNGFMRLRRERTQIEPAGVTAGKSFSGSNTLLKKFVREYMATNATISMMFASV